MRRSPLLQLRPGAVEVGYILFATCALILIENGRLLLERAGLIGSAHLIGAQVSTKVVWGTGIIDTFRFTANAINLIVWGATGLIIYSALQSVVQVLRTIQYERDFDSSRYVHPRGFTHQAYWRQVVVNALIGFLLLALLAIGLYAYIAIAVTDSTVYIQRFIVSPGLHNALGPFIGFDIAFVATGVIFLLVKLVIRHHRISKIEG